MDISRPLGVTIISIIMMIFGVMTFLGGAFLTIIMPHMHEAEKEAISIQLLYLSALGKFLGPVAIVYGIIVLIIGYFLWRGRNWARIVTIILVILSIIEAVTTIPPNVLSIIIGLAIIYYLTRSHVKEFFTQG